MGALRSCFARTRTWLRAGKYVNALAGDLPSRNGWSIAEHCGDRSPDCAQRLLNRASWDEMAVMSQVRKHAAAGLDGAARRCRRKRMTVGALDETGQEKQGSCTAGVKRQYMGCAGRVANGINTVHLSYVREKTGHALAGARQWIPEEQVKDRRWEVRSAGKGPKGERWYAWAWIATASPRHSLLVRRHLKTGELAFHYCFVPEGQLASKARLIRAAGLRWPVEEGFEFGKDYFGLDQCQARLYTAIRRHLVLVMAALAICAVTAAQLRDCTGTQAPPPARPDDPPPRDPGLIPLTVHEVKRLLAAALSRPQPPGHAARWLEWRRRHQARSRWFHQRAHLARNYSLVS
jgi:SRSO17 transposase